jgi:hypothetical protein
VTSEDVRSELDKTPFVPFRLHLVSGKTVDVGVPAAGWMLQNAILVMQPREDMADDVGYDVIALRNIERLEQLRNVGDARNDGGSRPDETA